MGKNQKAMVFDLVLSSNFLSFCAPVTQQQNIGPILQSKADLSSFCLEVSKKLDMRYESPPMPVNLSATSDVMKSFFADEAAEDVNAAAVNRSAVGPSFSSDDLLDVNQMFEIRKSM